VCRVHKCRNVLFDYSYINSLNKTIFVYILIFPLCQLISCKYEFCYIRNFLINKFNRPAVIPARLNLNQRTQACESHNPHRHPLISVDSTGFSTGLHRACEVPASSSSTSADLHRLCWHLHRHLSIIISSTGISTGFHQHFRQVHRVCERSAGFHRHPPTHPPVYLFTHCLP